MALIYRLSYPDVPQVVNITLSSVTILTTMNANAVVGAITVITTAPSGPYNGSLKLTGPDAASFTLSNGGLYPCNLVVGATSIVAGNYNIDLTAP
jgi:hypothetical protein